MDPASPLVQLVTFIAHALMRLTGYALDVPQHRPRWAVIGRMLSDRLGQPRAVAAIVFQLSSLFAEHRRQSYRRFAQTVKSCTGYWVELRSMKVFEACDAFGSPKRCWSARRLSLAGWSA